MGKKKGKSKIKENPRQESLSTRAIPRSLSEYFPIEIREGLARDGMLSDPVSELIRNGQQAFDIVRRSEIDLGVKLMFKLLEEQHQSLKRLIWKSGSF